MSAGDRIGAEDLHRILEIVPDAAVLVDLQGRISYVNDLAERMLGYSSKELVGRPIEILVPERVRETHARHRKAYAETPKKRPMGTGVELQARRKDGTEIPVDIHLSPLQTTAGLIVLAAIRDMTEQRRLMKNLTEQVALRQKFEQALRRAHTGHINRALFRTLGHAASVILYPAGYEAGASTFDFIRETWLPKNEAEFIKSVQEYFRLAGICSDCEIALDRDASRLSARIEDAFEAAERDRESREPVCHFLRGLLASLASDLLAIPNIVCEEKACRAAGGSACVFVAHPMLG